MLVKRNNYQPVYADYLNRFFGRDIFANFWDADERFTMPSANIREDEKQFQIEMAAPGYRKEDFHVQLTERNVLSVSAQLCASDKSEEDGRITRREHCYASFERSFTLPENVDMEHIEAKYENGMLLLTLPKKSEEKADASRMITVS